MIKVKATSKILASIIALLMSIQLFILTVSCERKEPKNEEKMAESQSTTTVPPVPQTQPTPTEQEPATTEEQVPIEEVKKYIYRVYEDESQPAQFVELVEFSTACEGIGDIFANNELIINPTLSGEVKIPLSRVVSITFDKFGLIDVTIKGVGKVDQPAAYRDNVVVLKNPDETINGVLVICRNLKGKKADGSEWSFNLLHDTAKKFHKIELVEVPE